MAIELEFIDFIVPIATIKAKYPGGWQQCLEDHANLIGGRIWYDEHLFRDGAMGHHYIDTLIEDWEAMGFTIYETDENGEPTKWRDVCVYASLSGGSNIDCDWLEHDWINGGVYLAGTEPGKLVGRYDFKAASDEE